MSASPGVDSLRGQRSPRVPPCAGSQSNGVLVLDVVFIAGILALIALVALVAKGVEKL